MKAAIEEWREVEATLDHMQKLTRERIFGTLPDTRRRKPLTKKCLERFKQNYSRMRRTS